MTIRRLPMTETRAGPTRTTPDPAPAASVAVVARAVSGVRKPRLVTGTRTSGVPLDTTA